MDPRLVPNASALLDDEAIAEQTAQQMHGRLSPALAQAAPMSGGPQAMPMRAQPAQPMPRQASMPPSAMGAESLGPVSMGAPAQSSVASRPVPAQAGRSGPAAHLSPEQLHDSMRNMLKSRYDEMGIAVDDNRLEELTKFAVAKRQGRLAKQMDKKSKAALSKYFSALVGRDTAEQSFAKESQSLQSKIASAMVEKDEEKLMQYRDQLSASKQQMEAKRQLASGYRDIIEKRYKIPSQYLSNPVSLFAFINDDTDDDFGDVLGDDEPQ